jgi:hypothetical protein
VRKAISEAINQLETHNKFSSQRSWFLYNKYIFHERLFPYLHKIQKLNIIHSIVVVEDRDSSYPKAHSVCEVEYALLGLIRAPRTPNSPDLNQLEPV